MKTIKIDPAIFKYDYFRGNGYNKSLSITKDSLYLSDSVSALRIRCNNEILGDEIIFLDFRKLIKYFRYHASSFLITLNKIEESKSHIKYKIFSDNIYICDSETLIPPSIDEVFKNILNKKKLGFSIVLESKKLWLLRYARYIKVLDNELCLYNKNECIYKQSFINEVNLESFNIQSRQQFNGFDTRECSQFSFSFYKDNLFRLECDDMEYLEVFPIVSFFATKDEFINEE